jgi:cap2 methyltransferase
MSYHNFSRNDLLINGDSPREVYRRRKDEEKTTIHWGQLKLFINEVEFFNTFWDPKINPTPSVVYAGAAPGIHIPFLSSMFPQFTFYLYDPSPFQITPTDKIHIYNQLFTDNDAAKWIGRTDVFLISDIRRDIDIVTGKMSETEIEQNVIADMLLQQNWVKMIKPQKSMLKFRPPYAYDNTAPSFKYLNGFIFIQPFGPQTTTETRLIPYDDLDEIEWDIKKYEEQLFYHNSIVREKFLYKNPLTNKNEPISLNQGLTNNYDSTAYILILKEYLEGSELKNEEITPDMVLRLSNAVISVIGRGKRTLKF